MNYKNLWLKLIESFEDAPQTNFGKKQIVAKMKEMELDEARKEIK